jgi:hypothetical protein
MSCKCKDVVHGLYGGDEAEHASLLVLSFHLQPDGLRRRIKTAMIQVTFTAINENDPDPEVDKAWPDGWFTVMPRTHEEISNTAATAKVGGNLFGVELSAELTKGTTKARDVRSMGVVSGRVGLGKGRRSGSPNCVTWRLLENDAFKTGVPVSLQGAIIVKREDLSAF